MKTIQIPAIEMLWIPDIVLYNKWGTYLEKLSAVFRKLLITVVEVKVRESSHRAELSHQILPIKHFLTAVF